MNESFQIPLILVSMGRAYYRGKMVEVEPFLQENTIEATGAGSFPDYHQKRRFKSNAGKGRSGKADCGERIILKRYLPL